MGKFDDLTGRTFGELTVLSYAGKSLWKCQCSCGTIKNIHAQSLKSGRTTSCGCRRRVLNSLNKVKDMTGQRFGEWEVLEYLGSSMWMCKCSCGVTRPVKAESLRLGKSTSCGHSTTGFRNLAGKIIGDWEVLEYIKEDRLWRCRCTRCKTIEFMQTSSLRESKVKTCKCHRISKKLIDITGKKFGKLTVIEYVGGNQWKCRCDCGRISYHYSHNLRRSNDTISCEYCANQLYSKEEILFRIGEFERENNRKPFRFELEQLLDRGSTSVERYIQRYDLYGEINNSLRSQPEIVLCKELNIKYHNCRNIIPGIELDMYIPEIKTAIEFDGTYWHSDLFKDSMYHFNKTIQCFKAGIRLIHVFEYEWEHNRDKIIEFLKHTIQNNGKKVHGRNTEIHEIGALEAKDFYEAHHLQGGVISDINIGIYSDNLLIGAISFSKPRFTDEYQYELTRLCYRNDIVPIGCTDKVFKYFIRMFNPESIVSYCDISKFTGKIYKKLGFRAVKFTDPGYVWADCHNNYLSRYQTMKHKLIKDGLGDIQDTEDSIMRSLGYYKIYNCGNIKFEWKAS